MREKGGRDLLVLTVRDSLQKDCFHRQLSLFGLTQKENSGFEFDETHIVEDNPPGAKIGSGGATLNVLLFLHELYGEDLFEKRVLILHSGGFCQRLPHVSACGKAFMMMPNGKTLLEVKLDAYRSLVEKLEDSQISKGFVFISATDVLESFDRFSTHFSGVSQNPAILLMAHESTLEVAEGHGVFIPTKNWRLKTVLQKPCAKLMRSEGAILSNGLVLTDSCYFIADGELLRALIHLRKEKGPVLCELCCYRDFLCPLGDFPRQFHFACDMDSELFHWQKLIANLMEGRSVALQNLGPNSFFHFGTPSEFLFHFCDANSPVREQFLIGKNGKRNISNCVYSTVETPNKQIPISSFVEWSELGGNCFVGKRSILSGIVYSKAERLELPDAVILMTLEVDGKLPNNFPIADKSSEEKTSQKMTGFITAMFPIDADFKASISKNPNEDLLEENLKWFDQSIPDFYWPKTEEGQEKSLWTAQIFPVCENATDSLLETLSLKQSGFQIKKEEEKRPRVSIDWMTKNCNVDGMLSFRKRFLIAYNNG